MRDKWKMEYASDEVRDRPPVGTWVKVWGRVTERVCAHPDDMLIQFESHNEHYNGHVRAEHVESDGSIPEFAYRCTRLYESPTTNALYRCESYEGHPDKHYTQTGLFWSESEVAGYIEEK